MPQNLNIGKKIIIAFISVCLISSIAGILGLIVNINIANNYSTVLVEQSRLLATAIIVLIIIGLFISILIGVIISRSISRHLSFK